jgi:hypothetical protein
MSDFFKGSRKFTVIIVLLVISTIFRCFDLLTSADFASLMSAVGVAFMGSNAVEHVLNVAKDWVAAKAAPKEEDQ